MALTVVSKPSGVQPVGGGKLVYVMTEASIVGKPNYRVQFQFNGYTGTLPIFEFRLDASLTLRADIAPILRGLLTIGEGTTTRMISTYVKYQAVWDGGSDAQVNLSGDVIFAFIGNYTSLTSALGGTNPAITRSNMRFYITSTDVIGPMLYAPASFYAWGGRMSYIEFIVDSTLYTNGARYVGATIAPASSVTNKPYILDNCALGAVPYCSISSGNATLYSSSGHIHPLSSDYINLYAHSWTALTEINTTNNAYAYAIFYGSPDITGGSGGSPGGNICQTFQAPVSASGNIKLLIQKIGSPTQTLTVKILGTIAGVPNFGDIKITLTFDLSSLISTTQNSSNAHYILIRNGSGTGDFNFVSGTTYAIFIAPNNDGVGDSNNYYKLYTSSASVYASGNVYVDSTSKPLEDLYGSGVLYGMSFISYKPIVYQTECDNPVHVKWINDMGGVSSWVFDYNQIYNMSPQIYGRYKTLQLFAKNLTLDAWMMLAELCRAGIDYGDNLKAGAYVHDMTDTANEFPIFITPKELQTETRKRQYAIDMVARYPLASNILL